MVFRTKNNEKIISAKADYSASTASPSPALSSISSGSLLLPSQQPKILQPKKKSGFLPVVTRLGSSRLTNFIWSGLFLVVVLVTLVVVAALTENVRRILWAKAAFKEEDIPLPPLPNTLDQSLTKSGSAAAIQKESCIYRRSIWEQGTSSAEIVHDLGCKWSAIVDHHEERCLIFDLHNNPDTVCPASYPWDLDLQVGVPSCRGPLARLAPIRRIMHHVCNPPKVNLSETGELIFSLCSQYKVLQVDRVIIQYFDRNFRRVAKRSVEQVINAVGTLSVASRKIALVFGAPDDQILHEIPNKPPLDKGSSLQVPPTSIPGAPKVERPFPKTLPISPLGPPTVERPFPKTLPINPLGPPEVERPFPKTLPINPLGPPVVERPVPQVPAASPLVEKSVHQEQPEHPKNTLLAKILDDHLATSHDDPLHAKILESTLLFGKLATSRLSPPPVSSYPSAPAIVENPSMDHDGWGKKSAVGLFDPGPLLRIVKIAEENLKHVQMKMIHGPLQHALFTPIEKEKGLADSIIPMLEEITHPRKLDKFSSRKDKKDTPAETGEHPQQKSSTANSFSSWEIAYNSVDDKGKLVRARSLEELMKKTEQKKKQKDKQGGGDEAKVQAV